MFNAVFLKTVSALCYSLIAVQDQGPRSPGIFGYNEAVAFVVEQWRRSPDFIRAALFLCTLLLTAFSIATTGRPLYGLDPNRRMRVLQRWRKMPLVHGRELLQFYEALAILGWQDSVSQQEKIQVALEMVCVP